MKRFDFVKLTNADNYKVYNLPKGEHGIIIKMLQNDSCDVLFFNPRNMGDYEIVNIKNKDFEIDKERFPKEFQEEFAEKLASKDFDHKDRFKPNLINDYDIVELSVEKERYTQDGIHKGAIGCVMDSNAVDDYILVDFSWVDENSNYFGDCISVKIDELKVIDNWIFGLELGYLHDLNSIRIG